MIAYFATFNGRVLVHEFGSSNLDRRATQMFVNRNNGAVARRSGNDSKPYAVLVVEFEPRPTEDPAREAGLPESVTVFGKVFTEPGAIEAFWAAWTDEERATYRAAQQDAERTAQADEAMHDMPASDTDGPFYDEETTVATPKKLGEMTPAERAAAVKSAAQRFQAELEANAPAIAEILEEERVATPADIVKRLQDSQYPLTAITALGWGMGPAQLGITDAVIEAERQGLVVTSMHNGKQMVTLALQDDEVPARPVPAPLALLRAYNAAHADEAIVAVEEPTEAEVVRCRDNGQHLLSSRHRAVECPVAAELAKAEALAGTDETQGQWNAQTGEVDQITAQEHAEAFGEGMEPVDQTAAGARAASAYMEGLDEGVRRTLEAFQNAPELGHMKVGELGGLVQRIRAELLAPKATRSPLWYGGNQ